MVLDRASLTSLVSVGLAVLAYLWYQSPLQSSRPFPAEESNLRSNFVDARPWEDPLEAVESHDRSETGAKRAPHHPFGLQQTREGQVAFLLVLTDGRPYPEGHETRLDDRYAVGSALAVACYIASGEDPLDYFTWPNDGDKNLLTSKQPLKVPFEWYKRRPAAQCADSGPFEHILVIWLNNQDRKSVV